MPNVVLITGAAGWLGGLLAHALKADPKTPDVQLILADIVEPKAPEGVKAATIKADLTDKQQIEGLFTTPLGIPDTVYCLHGIMSRGSEDNFDLGLKVRTSRFSFVYVPGVLTETQVNVDSVRSLLETTRAQKTPEGQLIKFIFTSSLAVYGGPLVRSPLLLYDLDTNILNQQPDIVTPSTIATPEGAYGMGKLTSELLVNEYTRRGFIDGRILRLPTIVVRPGVPSNATSAFISGIIREPLKGLPTTCPIGDSLSSPALSLPSWLASPQTTILNFVHAKHVPSSLFLPHTRVVCLPGFTATVREELEALERVGGEEALGRVRFRDDEVNRRIVSSWPARFDNGYAVGLGFGVDEGGMEPIVRQFKRDVEAGIA
ncbi:NAD-P-binding protein [Lyophyllum atratum]|nr:NAD-P-binding protein [Lyophyllum atratum]